MMQRPFVLILDFMGVMKRMAGSGRRSFTGNFGGVQGRFDVNLSVDNREFVAMCDRLKYSNLVKDADIHKAFAKVAKPVQQTVRQGARSSMRTDSKNRPEDEVGSEETESEVRERTKWTDIEARIEHGSCVSSTKEQ